MPNIVGRLGLLLLLPALLALFASNSWMDTYYVNHRILAYVKQGVNTRNSKSGKTYASTEGARVVADSI
ncbi:hypothetical protein BYT27DRAFT_7183292 [Phlegmacium glaucopus]|nr:hypothetical protein BYT27DRAFT_7183292 [Phlegmacium glaucopus]